MLEPSHYSPVPRRNLLLGPSGSGKSSLIATAIIHAHRLASLNVPVYRLPPSSDDAQRSHLSHKPKPLVTTQQSAFWKSEEVRQIDNADHIDGLCQDLWNNWLTTSTYDQGRDTRSRRRATSLGIFSIASRLLGLTLASAKNEYCKFVEVPWEMVELIARSREERDPTFGLYAKRRLFAAMDQAELVVICLPMPEVWSPEVCLLIQDILSITQEPKKEIVLALTKSDVSAANRAYRSRQAVTQFEDLSAEVLLEEIARHHPFNLNYIESLQSKYQVEIQACSSFGILRRSGTPNVDLANVSSSSASPVMKPLWPSGLTSTSGIDASAPETLKYWMPFGALESVLRVSDREVGQLI